MLLGVARIICIMYDSACFLGWICACRLGRICTMQMLRSLSQMAGEEIDDLDNGLPHVPHLLEACKV